MSNLTAPGIEMPVIFVSTLNTFHCKRTFSYFILYKLQFSLEPVTYRNFNIEARLRFLKHNGNLISARAFVIFLSFILMHHVVFFITASFHTIVF